MVQGIIIDLLTWKEAQILYAMVTDYDVNCAACGGVDKMWSPWSSEGTCWDPWYVCSCSLYEN